MPEGGEPFGTAGTRRGLSVCMLIGASGPSSYGGMRRYSHERMQKMRISLENEARGMWATCAWHVHGMCTACGRHVHGK